MSFLPYVKGLSEQLRRSLQQQGTRYFQVGDYAKIGVTGRPMQDRIKEHDRDIQVSDLKTARTPCCFRQLRSCSDRPLT